MTGLESDEALPERHTQAWREAMVEAYGSGEPTKSIAARFRTSASYPGALAARAGMRLRGAGATWKRRGLGGDPFCGARAS